MSGGVRGVARSWLRGWTVWITALVGAAMFAGAMSGMAYVRNSYEPPAPYPAIDEPDVEAGVVEASSSQPEPVRRERKAEAPVESRRPDPTPTATPRHARPKTTEQAASAEPTEPSSPAPSESPTGPFAGLSELFGGGQRR
ncbi:hypothetical protein G5C66_04675 [Nocardioides sp. KC13]|uniref:Uncharacterized protein n=1 Tax=Nocardioides turkmenicus TaxID=2711220 RepID=A0A6M1R039_9ACTN|nr:hypothetical protein [Nocardioides sp. KC13]NGN92031.1 hypothetical protein [Nocardioides sp. KC13]